MQFNCTVTLVLAEMWVSPLLATQTSHVALIQYLVWYMVVSWVREFWQHIWNSLFMPLVFFLPEIFSLETSHSSLPNMLQIIVFLHPFQPLLSYYYTVNLDFTRMP